MNETVYVLPARPVGAYAECRWEAGCTYCGAPGGEYCRREDGQNRRIPCVRRMIPTSPDVSVDDVTERRQLMRSVHDFSEPRHREEA